MIQVLSRGLKKNTNEFIQRVLGKLFLTFRIKNGGKIEQIFSNDIHTTMIKKTEDLQNIIASISDS